MRINFFGGPGSGKSTTAAQVFAELKRRGYSIEHVNEYVKAWAYAGRRVDPYDQFYLQAKQMQYEYRYLKHGVKNIVTDSPVALGYVYANEALKPILRQISDTFDNAFPTFNIFILRGDKPYVAAGRYESKEKALEVDERIKREVHCLYYAPFTDFDTILKVVETQIDK